jgi:hypothetical protein
VRQRALALAHARQGWSQHDHCAHTAHSSNSVATRADLLPLGQRALLLEHLDVVAAVEKLVGSHHGLKLGAPEVGETPVLRLDDELTSGELELAAAVRLDDVGLVLVLGAARDEDLSDLDACGRAVRLAVPVMCVRW